jgi:hypothetical protein
MSKELGIKRPGSFFSPPYGEDEKGAINSWV